MELVRPDTRIDFVGQARKCAVVSAVLVTAVVVLAFVRGLELGIDFAGGTVLQVAIPEQAGPVDEGTLRGIVGDAGHPDAVVVRFGAVEERSFLVSVPVSKEKQPNLEAELIGALSKGLEAPVERQRIESVGPRIGAELRRSGIGALVLSWALILIYIWFRFEIRYAPGAVAALIHDVLITAGVFIVLGFEFNLQVLAALLVVIGYSLNDTIVIYDRIRENIELRGRTHLEDVVNQSVNQTLSRTLLTSLTTLLVVGTLLLFGGAVIRDFAFALMIGVVVGTYSTIYIASAMLIFLERRFGRSTSGTRPPRRARAGAKG
jgi:preprotein translocase subunit SecF